MNSKDVRQRFIDFFIKKSHTYAKPSPVVPQNDPTLLFINAGMNQFKDILLGEGSRDYTRAVNSQACIRVSGKHNDLEEVGLDGTHLTLFEMLGNWSFGDYYKKEAIEWAWELFTKEYKIPKDIIYATVFETDKESYELWKTYTDINPDHIEFHGAKDNFWEMGETGPCGPCSEIHIDLGSARCEKKGVPGHVCKVNGDCERYTEFWNLVFIQYNRKLDGTLEDLPNKHVDTGAGLERVVSYMQGVNSVYETDLFMPIINKIEKISGVAYQPTKEGMPHRVMADHIRTLVFAISDNVMPSNEGRGYVLRRILRRALRYAKQLGINEPILFKLVQDVVDKMGTYFEALPARQSFIEQIIKAEEEGFLRTLEGGITLFEELVKNLKSKNKTVIPGKEVFKLYDTFGFPVDLTAVMAKEAGIGVDIQAFEAELTQQKERSRKAQKEKLNQDVSDNIEMDLSWTEEDLNIHLGKNNATGGEAVVPKNRDEAIKMARHHTATHLIQAAMQKVLGDHVTQAGSLVDIDRLRFDFSHFKSVSEDELSRIQSLVNEKVDAGLDIEIYEMPIEAAKEQGAMALFGEQYGDIVRVVEINDFSKELCGGTHLKNTSDIEQVKIIQETSIASGTRRIEALAGKENIDAYEESKKQSILKQIKTKINQMEKIVAEMESLGETFPMPESFHHIDALSVAALIEAEKQSVEVIKTLEKKFEKLKNEQAGKDINATIDSIQKIGGYAVLAKVMEGFDVSILRTLSDNIMNAYQSKGASEPLIIILASEKDGKGFFLVKCDKNADLSKVNAKTIMSTLNQTAGGGGGGRPDMTQAGGAEPTKLQAAIDAVITEIQ